MGVQGSVMTTAGVEAPCRAVLATANRMRSRPV